MNELPRKVCTYCLKPFTKKRLATKDHVFPKAWYPENSKKLRKWTVPACFRCNQKFGKLESYLFTLLGLTLSAKETGYQELRLKAFRSKTPESGKTTGDKEARRRMNERLKKLIFKSGDVSKIKILHRDVKPVYKKIVKGLALVLHNRLVEKSNRISLRIYDENKVFESGENLDRFHDRTSRGPGFEVVFSENENRALKAQAVYYVTIWNKFRFESHIFEGKIPEYTIMQLRERHVAEPEVT